MTPVATGPVTDELTREVNQLVDDAKVRLAVARSRGDMRAVDFTTGQLRAYRLVLEDIAKKHP